MTGVLSDYDVVVCWPGNSHRNARHLVDDGLGRGNIAEAREAYEQAGTAADVRRIPRKQAEWQEAAALEGDDADLEWLLEVDRLAAARPAGLGARLYEQERRRLAETLEKMRDDDRAGA